MPNKIPTLLIDGPIVKKLYGSVYKHSYRTDISDEYIPLQKILFMVGLKKKTFGSRKAAGMQILNNPDMLKMVQKNAPYQKKNKPPVILKDTWKPTMMTGRPTSEELQVQYEAALRLSVRIGSRTYGY